MFKDISSVSLAFVYINILGYVFHSVVGRSLGPAGYGEFIVLYSFMLTVGYLTNLLAIVSIKTIVENFTQRYEFLRALRKLGFIIGTAFAVLAFAGASSLKDFLYVTKSYYFIIVAFAWFGMFMLAVERSFLQSTGKFPLFAFSSGLELTLRLIVAVLVLYFGFKVGGVLFSSVAGVFTVLLFLLSMNSGISGEKASLDLKRVIKIALYVCPSGFFVYADDIFIRRIFDEQTAGFFASVSIAGKVLIWFTITILGVYFPKFVKFKESRKLKKFIFQMFGIVLLAQVFSQLVILVAGKYLFLLLFGYKFEPAFHFLPYYFLAVLPLLLNIVFISIATATEKGFYLIYFHLFLYYLGFLLIPFNSIYSYLKYIFLFNFLYFLIYALFFRVKLSKV